MTFMISRGFFGQTGTYIEFMKTPPRWHRTARFFTFVPEDVLKMHCLALSVLRSFVKSFSNY